MHSNVRKNYLQRLKSKGIQVYHIQKKWMNMIENMTHERTIWHDPANLCSFFILDQTEGPNRERRRLRKSHLYIAERFFKPEVKPKLENEKQPSTLRYLISNGDDGIGDGGGGSGGGGTDGGDTSNGSSTGGGSVSSGDYMLYHKTTELLILK